MLRENIKYSEKELLLFKHFCVDFLTDYVEPLVLYRMCVENAFMTNDHSDYSKSLRNCIEAMNKGNPFRLTEEFDNLIDI